MENKLINSQDLEIGDCFHFKKGGALHMVTDTHPRYITYRQYSDGKTRIFYTPKEVVKASEYSDKLYELKWFK